VRAPGLLALEVEEGVGSPCADLVVQLDGYQAAHAARWGSVETMGWTVRVRVFREDLVDGPGTLGGVTWWGDRVIDVYQHLPNVFPHDLHHVLYGQSSADHHGWCLQGFVLWEASVVGLDEQASLCGSDPSLALEAQAPQP